MSLRLHIIDDTASEKLVRLVQELYDIQDRIKDLTGGEADTVMDASGSAYLLPAAQMSLRESEHVERGFAAQREAILNALPAHIALLDPTGEIITVNEAWKRFAQANELRDDNFCIGWNYISVCDSVRGNFCVEARDVAVGIRAVLAGDIQEFTLEYPCHSPLVKRWYKLMVTPLDPGRRVGAVVMHVDISERKLAEVELRESQQRFQELAEHVKDVFFSYESQDGKVLYVSPAYETMWDRSCQSLYENPISFLEAVHEEDRALAQDPLERAARGEQAVVEFRIRRPDGEVRWIVARFYPVIHENGAVERVVGTAQDITDRKQAELRMADQAALLDKASDAILVRDLENRVLYWNRRAEEMYGWTAEDARGRPVADLIYDDAAPLTAATSEVLRVGEWSGELEQRAKSGSKLTVLARLTLLRDTNGEPRGILSIGADITERKRLEQQLLRSQRMESIGTLASGIAHDLNNILSPIVMAIEILREQARGKEDISLIDTLQGSAQRGADLVRQILGFARGAGGTLSVVNPVSIVEDVHRITRETFPRNINFRVQVPDGLWRVNADATQLHQVIMNLCVNARDAMPEGGQLTVAMRNIVLDDDFAGMSPQSKPGPYVLISVKDTGHGMTREVQDKIFEPFFTTKELGRGTGLGLSTSFTIVKYHGGFINCYSELGRGTKFKVYLPALTATEWVEEATATQSLLPRGHGELILLVDDEASIRDITRKSLEYFGYRVMVAVHGADALSIYAQHREEIAVVITDMSMPVMDGPTMILALRSIDPSVRIIGSSGLSSDSHVTKAIGAGIEYFVPKPYTAESILTALRKILAGAEDTPAPPVEYAPPAQQVVTEAPAPEVAHAQITAKILFVDDEAALAMLSGRMLSATGHKVEVVNDGAAALALLVSSEGAFDLVITDLHMPVLDGEGLYRDAIVRYPGLRFIFASGDLTVPRFLVDAFGKDAKILSKPYSAQDLREAVQASLHADFPLPPRVPD